MNMHLQASSSQQYGHSVVQLIPHNNPLVYLFGGLLLFPLKNKTPECTNDLHCFDFMSKKWTRIFQQGDVPASRYFHSAVAFEHRMVVFGGKGARYFNDVHVFDSYSNTWTKRECRNAPTPRFGHSAVIHEENMLIYGGYDLHSFCCDEFYMINLRTLETWTQVQLHVHHPATLPGLYHHSAVVLEKQNHLLIFGGLNELRMEQNKLIDIDLRSFELRELTTVNQPEPRYGHQMVVNGNNLIILGGRNHESDLPHAFSLDVSVLPFQSHGVWKQVVEGVSNLLHCCAFTQYIDIQGEVYSFGGITCFNNRTNPILGSALNTNHSQNRSQMEQKHFPRTAAASCWIASDLPVACILEILKFLEVVDLCHLQCASKHWIFAICANQEEIWANVLTSLVTNPMNEYFVQKYADDLCSSEGLSKRQTTLLFSTKIRRDLLMAKERIDSAIIACHSCNPVHRYIGHRIISSCKLHEKNGGLTNDSVRIAILGDDAVGKSSFLWSYSCNSFPLEPLPTLYEGTHVTTTIQDQKINVHLFDYSAREDCKFQTRNFHAKMHVFLVCFSVVNPSSFFNVMNKWLPEIFLHSPSSIVILCGLKTDLRDDPQVHKRLLRKGQAPISKRQAKQLAKKSNLAAYMECSSKRLDGIRSSMNVAIVAGARFCANKKDSGKNNACSVQ